MADRIAKTHVDQLDRIKTTVRRAHDYFKPNYDRYNEFRRFIFESSLKEEEITLLATLSRPQLEFNVLEAYISRLLGEFSKQEPDIMVSADNENNADPQTIKIVEQHLRHTLTDSKNEHTRYEVYKDILTGGFSGLKMSTDYSSPMSFHQIINIERVFDPTLCGYDPLARYSHKGDGRFCFELFPMSKEEFQIEYPDVPLEQMNFRRDFAGFNWSYLMDSTPTMIVADFYEKKKKKVKIVQLADGSVMTEKKYSEMGGSWTDIAVMPTIVGKPRTTEIETVDRYRLIENQMLEHVSTDFSMLPLIFVDGNSALIKTPKNGNIRQLTRPYVYHAKGAQRLKNYAGIALANEIENIVQHKFIIKKEALPKEEDWLQAIKDIQKPSNIVVNAFYEEDPNQPIPDPIREIAKIPAPPEILNAFTGADSLIQGILGSYDAALGINDNQLSGVALVEAATQSNAAAMPYIVGYLQGYQRAAQIYVDLMPKYFTTPRTMPVRDEEGNRSYIPINQEGGMDMDFDTNALNVVVKAGASFTVQKSRTINMVKEIMGMSPMFEEFIATKGINFVLDNMEGRGVEQLKSMVDEYQQEKAQEKQMAMQQAQQQLQNNPLVMKNQIEIQKLHQENEQFEKESELKEHELEIKLLEADLDHDARLKEAAAEKYRADSDVQMKEIEFQHRSRLDTIKAAHAHAKDIAAHHHNVKQSKNQNLRQGASKHG